MIYGISAHHWKLGDGWELPLASVVARRNLFKRFSLDTRLRFSISYASMLGFRLCTAKIKHNKTTIDLSVLQSTTYFPFFIQRLRSNALKRLMLFKFLIIFREVNKILA